MRGDAGGVEPFMASRSFAVTFDYRCPFARNAHEYVLEGLAAGGDWAVRFVPFSLSQSKEATWNREADSALLTFELAIAVRDTQPDRFLDLHRHLFAIRHDHGKSTRDADALREALEAAGVDVDAAYDEVASGRPLETVRLEHEAATKEHTVWGVPTFIAGDQAAFVRLMERPAKSAVEPVQAVERVLDMLEGWAELNEFKHTALPR
jgi:predicted DsbA family dithiol-disulfide isomerase